MTSDRSTTDETADEPPDRDASTDRLDTGAGSGDADTPGEETAREPSTLETASPGSVSDLDAGGDPAGRGWSVLGDGPTSKAETVVVLCAVVAAGAVFLPWYEIVHGEYAATLPDRFGGQRAPSESYAGYEYVAGLVVLASAILLLAVTWRRRWGGLTATVGAFVGVVLYVGPAIGPVRSAEGVRGVTVTELPDGVVVPLEAVEVTREAEAVIAAGAITTVASVLSLLVFGYRRIRQ